MCEQAAYIAANVQCSMWFTTLLMESGKRNVYDMVWCGMVAWYGMVRYESTPYYDENEKQNFKDSKKKMYCTMHNVDG